MQILRAVKTLVMVLAGWLKAKLTGRPYDSGMD